MIIEMKEMEQIFSRIVMIRLYRKKVIYGRLRRNEVSFFKVKRKGEEVHTWKAFLIEGNRSRVYRLSRSLDRVNLADGLPTLPSTATPSRSRPPLRPGSDARAIRHTPCACMLRTCSLICGMHRLARAGSWQPRATNVTMNLGRARGGTLPGISVDQFNISLVYYSQAKSIIKPIVKS